jgi:hypothetical protein
MKTIFLAIMFMMFNCFASEDKPATWGNIIKTKNQTYGHQYFVHFKKEGNDYVYPLSAKSQIDLKKLESLVGKFAKIYGETSFEPIELDNTKHIMTFLVKDARELTLSDLNQEYESYSDRLNVPELIKKRGQTESAEVKGLSNKAINAAIFVGGAALALEVLKNAVRP